MYILPSKMLFCGAIGKNPPEKLGRSSVDLINEGMTMCLKIASTQDDNSQVILVAGYESGHACLYNISASSWSLLYCFKSHSQPVLSVAIHPSQDSFYSSSADANLAHHPIAIATLPPKVVNMKHSGRTCLSVREDGRLLLSAGWDGCGRIYSTTTLRQVAVLKWHTGGVEVAGFSRLIEGKIYVVLGGKDAKLSMWDVFNDDRKHNERSRSFT